MRCRLLLRMRGFAAAWEKAEAQSACASVGGEAGLRPGPVVLAPELCSHRGAICGLGPRSLSL